MQAKTFNILDLPLPLPSAHLIVSEAPKLERTGKKELAVSKYK